MGVRTIQGRVRAWVFVKADDPSKAAEDIYTATGNSGENRWVVVRADVVTGVEYDIIIPVDAADEEALGDAQSEIEAVPDSTVVAVAKVERHVPYPPHDAQGYITTQEVEVGKHVVEKPGRQGTSPGPNPFG